MSQQRQSNSLSWIDAELERNKRLDLFRTLAVRESPHVSGMIQLDGEQLYDFGSNDYLSLSADPRIVDAVKRQVGYVGWGSGASPLISGRGTLHARLEAEIAQFENSEAALTFSSGYLANLGAITALIGSGDYVLSDARNHASIIDGCRLSGATVKVFRHNDVEHLRELIDEVRAAGGRRLIVTEGIFSMGGDLAPLPAVQDLAQQTGSMLMVDEAHATGVLGRNGRGACEFYDLKHEVDIVVGTLSKAIGCHGGFVAGRRSLIDWLINSARSFIFSTAVPDVGCIAAATAIQMIPEMHSERKRLLDLASTLRTLLTDNDFDVGASSSQIVPVILGRPDKALWFKERLREKGFFVPAIRPPAVPDGESLLRISLNAAHDEDLIKKLVNTLIQVAADCAGPASESIS